jgi:hypothetical protein
VAVYDNLKAISKNNAFSDIQDSFYILNCMNLEKCEFWNYATPHLSHILYSLQPFF